MNEQINRTKISFLSVNLLNYHLSGILIYIKIVLKEFIKFKDIIILCKQQITISWKGKIT